MRRVGARKRKQVLIVEDDLETRKFIVSEILSRFPDLSSCEASNGEEAIQLFNDSMAFSLVISDYQMPVCDGAKFVAFLVEKEIKTSVIIFTGHSSVPITLSPPVIKIIGSKNFTELGRTLKHYFNSQEKYHTKSFRLQTSHYHFGKYMKGLRVEVGLAEDDVAFLLGVSKDLVESWERGEELPSKAFSSQISYIFKIKEVEWLECFDVETSK